MNYLDNEKAEIISITNDIWDIDAQLMSTNPDRNKMIQLLEKGRMKFPLSTQVYEKSKLESGPTIQLNAKELPMKEISDRLIFYKELYINELRDKYKIIYDK